MLVARNIGRTKTDLAIFSSEAGPHAPLAQERVHSADYPSLQAIVKEFLAKAQKPAGDPSVVIINQCVDPAKPSKVCATTLELFVTILVAEAGNLAVKFLATGGVYLAGGVAVHTLQMIKQPAFIERFKRKGRFADLLGRIPVHVVVTPAGLAEAAAFGLENSELN
jgi:glucokinase